MSSTIRRIPSGFIIMATKLAQTRTNSSIIANHNRLKTGEQSPYSSLHPDSPS
jgi:hypothetical protein